jgi:Ni,Fe-hydrogenase maturation factor
MEMEEKNNMEQTAVEWLVDYLKNIKELPFIRQNLNMNEQNILDDIIEQAKEMEKQQIIDAINFGDERGKITTYKSSEQYYNETFKSDEAI